MTRFLRRSFVVAATFFALLGMAHSALAATVTWSPTSGRNWSTPGNWSTGSVPGPADDVVADGSVHNNRIDIDTSIDVKSITTTASYTRNINFIGTSANTYRVRGDVKINGSGNFECTTNTTQIDGNVAMATGSGNFSANGGNVTISGNVNQSDGTINNVTGTFIVGGNLNESGTGTFSAGAGGTITIMGAVNGSGGDVNANSGPFSVGTNVALTGGNFTGSSGTVTIPGNVTASSGTFTAGSGTTTVGGFVSLTGGSFTGSGGTVSITGDVTASSGTYTGGTGSTTTIGGNVNLTGGNFTVSNGTMSITGGVSAGSGTFTCGTQTLTIGGNVSITGGTFNGSSGLIVIGGSLSPYSSGTFKASSGTTRIGGAFNHTGGTYNDNNGNLLFTAKTNQTHTFGGAAFKKVTLNDGMLGYWNFDENGGSTQNDNSGYTNTGASTSLTWGTAAGPGLTFSNTSFGTFNGSSSRVSLTVSQLPAANAAQSIAAWVKITALPGTTSSIVALTGSSSAVKLGLSSSNLQVLKNGGTALISTSAPSTGTWHHVAYTWDGSSNNLFVDGVAVTPTATAHDSGAVTAGFIGATSAAVDFFNGSIDEVRVYDRALTATEVSALALGSTPGTSIATHTFSDAYTSSVGTNVADMVICSGTVAGSSTLSIEGSWFNYGGRFTGTGTVTFTSAAAEVLQSGGSSFAALTINRSGANYTLRDRLWVPNGAFTLTQGRIQPGSYTMHVGSMTLSAGTFTVGTSTIVMDGTSNSSLPSSILTGYYNLRLEDPSESSLVGYWKLDEGTGPATRDWSTTGNTGTLSSGAGWTSASTTIGFDNAAAASFNGTSGYVSAGSTSLPAANASQTISAWVNITALPGSASSIVALTGSSSAVKLGLSPTLLRVLRNDGTVLISTSAPSTGTWHHVAYTWNGSSNNLYVDGVAVTSTATAHDSAAVTGAFIGATSAGADFFSGKIDDVRIYSTPLTASQVAQLAAGRYAGTGGYATYTLGANTTASNLFAIDAGNLSSSSFTFGATAASPAAAINAGTYTVGSAAQSFTGGLTVQPGGTLTMATSGGSVRLASGTTLTMDGTLNASSTSATIRSVSGTYAFSVGSTASARPTLNITGLAVQNTDTNGMRINVDHGAVTTFTRFDSVVFTSGTGSTFLNIYATALYLPSSGARFGITTGGVSDASLPTNNIVLAGNGTADGDTRIVFGSATCASTKTTSGYCQHAWASDDDSDGNGVGNTPATNGAVVQYVKSASTDVAGSIEGFPTAAFDWNTGAYYSTYVAYHDTSGTTDTIYVRDQTGAAKNGDSSYKWDTPSGETIVGTPRWMTVSGSHILWVALASGKVYRLVDSGTTLTPDTSGNWAGANNPFDCGCTIVSPLAMDASNLYWGGTTSGPTTQKIWTLGQTSRAQPVGSPFVITPTITSASPSFWVNGATTYLFMGLTGNIIKFNASSQVIDSTNTNPGSASVYGRIIVTATNLVFAGDDGGTMWSMNPNVFSGTNKLWSYVVSGDSIKSAAYYDYTSTTLHFGTEAGKVVVLNSSGTALTGYPYVPGTASDPIRSSVLYFGGILAVGTTTGKLFFLDRNNGTTGPALVREYYFGPMESVSGIGYDGNASRYMISTADPSSNDGKLYYIDVIADPTPGSS